MDASGLKARVNRRKRRKLIIQSALIVFSVLITLSAIQSARINLEALGLVSGFEFLERSTGWS